MKFVSDCLTGKDNLTYDAGRVIGVLGALMYVAFWVVQVVACWRKMRITKRNKAFLPNCPAETAHSVTTRFT